LLSSPQRTPPGFASFLTVIDLIIGVIQEVGEGRDSLIIVGTYSQTTQNWVNRETDGLV
jgi:hypothetical protein